MPSAAANQDLASAATLRGHVGAILETLALDTAHAAQAAGPAAAVWTADLPFADGRTVSVNAVRTSGD